MPYLVTRESCLGTTTEIHYAPRPSRNSERLGRETSRVEITDAQAKRGLDKLSGRKPSTINPIKAFLCHSGLHNTAKRGKFMRRCRWCGVETVQAVT